jgi:hypothetical protein
MNSNGTLFICVIKAEDLRQMDQLFNDIITST